MIEVFNTRHHFIPETRASSKALLQGKIKGLIYESNLPLTSDFWMKYQEESSDLAREANVTYRTVYFYSPQFLACIDAILAEVSHDMSTNGCTTHAVAANRAAWWQQGERMRAFEKAFPGMWTYPPLPGENDGDGDGDDETETVAAD